MPKHSDLSYSFQALQGRSEFEVVSFELDEAISTPFQLKLELVSFEDDVDFGQLLDKPVLFTLWQGERALRHVHGLVSSFSQSETGFYRTRYRALVEPTLARAALRSNWRIFQQKTVPQIIEIMLSRQGITAYEFKSVDQHLAREFCVQAGETDLDFIARLAAEEGFVYRFEHTATTHKLLISDRVLAFGLISQGVLKTDEADTRYQEPSDKKPYEVLYHSNSGGDQASPCLHHLRYSEQVRPARQVQRDYTFTHPAYRQEHLEYGTDLKHQSTQYERFDYPGRYKRDAVGKPFTATRITALRHDARIAEVAGDDVRIQPGLSFTLTEHPRENLNMHWRVTRIHHEGAQLTSLEDEAAGAQQGTCYEQQAVLVPGRSEWRPAPLPKPRIDGPHMATVVGPKGEEIYCDEWGRVKVSFPWDRESEDNEFSSCWIRVSQGWAGGSWGSMAIPRIGQDVVVQYVNADPDQPLITGRTYCGNQLPPYDLPKHKTRMTIKSQTHKGDGFNEMRFEDELGQEEVFIHAQRDQNNIVKHDETTRIGNNREEQVEHDESIVIGNDRSESVGNDERVTIGRDAFIDGKRNRVIRVGKDHMLEVGNNRHDRTAVNHLHQVGGHQQTTVQGSVHLVAGQDIQQDARRLLVRMQDEILLESAGGTLLINDSGITLKGVALHIEAPIDTLPKGDGSVHPASGTPAPGADLDLACGMRSDGSCTRTPCPCRKVGA
ncbi:type VI secretion system Vgr family protein [Pseudomonas sp. S32]|uniref:type VI secretion system Vgr family protein n=1 Tax=Pseudomonas sp. S32 TaxID=2767448 RepID=UPI00191261AC|nr:type VI secretion system tip protein TssI/VgrG [Pseudomonas sp. S32]MBK5003666.1 type VI secretion system tip protein VgrG [Pseudomonas sp. S32]